MIQISETVAIALEVLNNGWGTGEERKRKLTEEGYDYNSIQGCVNDLVAVFEKWGD